MGAVDDVKGKAKEAVGDATGNRAMKREGQVDQGKGKVKDEARRRVERELDLREADIANQRSDE